MTVDLGDRKLYIGGSDVAAALGCSRWKTKLSLWMEKVGLHEIIVNSMQAKVGTELEDFVAKQFSEETGLEVVKKEEAIIDKEKEYLKGHIDRYIPAENAILECKTCGERMAEQWKDDEIPGDYFLQVYFYLMVSGLKKAYIAVLIANRDFKIKTVTVDAETAQKIQSMRKHLIDFWENFVVPKNMPTDFMADDKDPLLTMYPINRIPKMIEFDDEIAKKLEEHQSLKSDIGSLTNRKDVIENEVRAAIGEADGGVVGDWQATWKQQKKGGCQIDLIAFRNQQPEMYAQYTKKDNMTRVLRIKNKGV